MADWFETWFNSEYYLKIYSHRDQLEAERAVNLILEKIRFLPKLILDVACGSGRHAVVFAEHGLCVIANDLSKTLLFTAEETVKKNGLQRFITFSNQDMRYMKFEHSFDLIVQLFTSFGYFDNASDDLTVLHQVWKHLSPEGVYVLDVFNEFQVMTSLPKERVRRIDNNLIHENVYSEGEFIIKMITINGESKFVEKVRKYSFENLQRLVIQSGFSVIDVVGSYEGEPFSPLSDRIIFFLKKV